MMEGEETVVAGEEWGRKQTSSVRKGKETKVECGRTMTNIWSFLS